MTSPTSQDSVEVDTRVGAARNAMDELHRAYRAIERTTFNITEHEKQTALKAFDNHVARAIFFVRGKE